MHRIQILVTVLLAKHYESIPLNLNNHGNLELETQSRSRILNDQLLEPSLNNTDFYRHYSASNSTRSNASVSEGYKVDFKLNVSDKHLSDSEGVNLNTNFQQILSNVTGSPLQNITVSVEPVAGSGNLSSAFISIMFHHREAADTVVNMIETGVLENKIIGDHQIVVDVSRNPKLIEITAGANSGGIVRHDNAYCSKKTCPRYRKKYQNSKWMSKIPDETKLVDLSIPATHNTMAFYGGIAGKCQSMSLKQQLERGIRGLDIRCRNIKDRFAIHHGVAYQKAYFGNDVLKVCRDFLKDNPQETIFMHIQEADVEPKDNTRSWHDTRRWYFRRWYAKNVVVTKGDVDGKETTLGDVRGKIIYNFEADVGKDDKEEQDEWETRSKEKWGYVKKYFDRAMDDDGETLYINYLSSSHWKEATYPYDVARRNNGKAADYLKNKFMWNDKRVGIIYMDFPGGRLISEVIKRNVCFRGSWQETLGGIC